MINISILQKKTIWLKAISLIFFMSFHKSDNPS